jgi:hypothetical protein
MVARAGRRVYPLGLHYASLRNGTANSYLLYHAVRRSLGLFRDGTPVPWVSYLFPPEILASYRLTPLIPEVAATTLGGFSLVRDRLDGAVNRLPLSRDVCSYHRVALAGVQEGLIPPPTICLGTSPLCVGKEMFMEQVAADYGVPFRHIRVPVPPDEGPTPDDDVQDVAQQLRRVHEDLGAATGRRPDLDRAVRLSNRAVDAWNRLAQARVEGEVIVGGREAFGLTFLSQILWGTEAGARGFEKLLSERGRSDLMPRGFADEQGGASRGGRLRLRRQGASAAEAPALGSKARLLWLHTVPHYDPTLFSLIAEGGAVVVLEEMAQPHADLLDPDDPFSGLARRLVEHPLWGSSARRARLVIELAKRGRIDGVVHFNHWGCRHGVGSVPVLREALREAGIPFVAVDGDALAHESQEGAARQMEAFLELLTSAPRETRTLTSAGA